MVPAPTACTDADAPPLNIRITMSMAIESEMALRMLKMVTRQKDTKYMVRRPSLSLKDDHHSGKMDMLNMYREMDKFVMVVVVSRSLDTWDRDAKRRKPDKHEYWVRGESTYGKRSNCPWGP